MTFAEKFGNLLRETIEEAAQDQVPPTGLIATDTLAQALEKLIIVHIRIWSLTDAQATANTDEKYARLGRQVDHCFKVIRPRLIYAINAMLAATLMGSTDWCTDHPFKHYKGYDE